MPPASRLERVLRLSLVSKSAGAVDVIEEDLIPEEYYIEVITTKLDKKRILEELKEGASIPGVRLVQKEYVRGLK